MRNPPIKNTQGAVTESNPLDMTWGGEVLEMIDGPALRTHDPDNQAKLEAMRVLLVEIKAELVTLNASINAGITVSIG